jgi:hypothetical protein
VNLVKSEFQSQRNSEVPDRSTRKKHFKKLPQKAHYNALFVSDAGKTAL